MSPVPYTAVDIHAHHVGPDVRARLGEMDRVGLSHQVISPVPAAMEQAWLDDPGYARAVNDSIAEACAAAGGRLLGLGCLPAADPVAELDRCLRMGLRGVEIGTRMGKSSLDSPELAPVWAGCEGAGASVFVHPVARGRGVLCRADPALELGLGMPVDTAAAASALVFGGVLARHPRLRIALAHGGGAFPGIYPRLRMVTGGPPEQWDELVRLLYIDTLVLDPGLLPVLAHRFGTDRLLLGTDSPFLPDRLDEAVRIVTTGLPDTADMAVRNALAYLGLAAAV
ncbi:amidohydrolase family protein [Amycolatopsis pithecellobii]|uniref:amidohydrolase family protein n=1 Tax=Amycolatopsis pithecellobii TaxID=664692 RepID=UPI0012B70E91|nr:amidohydrolase family protein [Amycolatopsis pithecellobii]